MKNVVFAALAVLGLVLGTTSLTIPASAGVHLHQANDKEGGHN
jgi:hypothetical protein